MKLEIKSKLLEELESVSSKIYEDGDCWQYATLNSSIIFHGNEYHLSVEVLVNLSESTEIGQWHNEVSMREPDTFKMNIKQVHVQESFLIMNDRDPNRKVFTIKELETFLNTKNPHC